MSLNDVTRTVTFRLAVSFSLAFSAVAALLFAFIYWQTTTLQIERVDRFMTRVSTQLAAQPAPEALQAVELSPDNDLHSFTFGAIFGPGGAYLSGNLTDFPPGLRTDGRPHEVRVDGKAVRAVARRLRDGRVLVIGRKIETLQVLRQVVAQALVIGLVPAVLLSILLGVLLSTRTLRRLRLLHQAIERIMHGDLHERLPVRGTSDDLDRLVASVNFMLDELEGLVAELRHAGDNIAHDIRTPLSRVRARLERGRAAGKNGDDLKDIVDKAITDLDHVTTVISALLRIGEIEGNRRREYFALVDIGELAREVGELYQPIAEQKHIFLEVETEPTAPVAGDRDLLMEILVNLVDNAIKFTLASGTVTIAARQALSGPVLSVRDNGPGIDNADKLKIFRRFYRADKSRHVPGNGLGLSIADAIARLHGFSLTVQDAMPGALFELRCTRAPIADDNANAARAEELLS